MRLKGLVLAGGLALMLAPAALADNITMKFLGGGSGRSVTFSTNSGGSYSSSVHAGQMKWNVTGVSGDTYGHGLFVGANIITFCTELSQSIAPGNEPTYKLVPLGEVPDPPMTETQANRIRNLYDNHWASVSAFGGVGNDLAAAFQIAIWEIVNETSATLNVNDGSFRIDGASAARTQANTWLAALSSEYDSVNYQVMGLEHGGKQDQILAFQLPPTVIIPLPPAAWMGLAGLAGIAVLRRRRSA